MAVAKKNAVLFEIVNCHFCWHSPKNKASYPKLTEKQGLVNVPFWEITSEILVSHCIPIIYIYIPIDRYLHPHDILMILRIWWQLSFHSGFIPLYLINFPIDFPIYISIYRWLGISNIYLPNWYPIYIPMYIYIYIYWI